MTSIPNVDMHIAYVLDYWEYNLSLTISHQKMNYTIKEIIYKETKY